MHLHENIVKINLEPNFGRLGWQIRLILGYQLLAKLPSETCEPGARAPQDFAINKEVPFSFLENAPFFLRKKCPRSVVAPKFEMLPIRPWFILKVNTCLPKNISFMDVDFISLPTIIIEPIIYLLTFLLEVVTKNQRQSKHSWYGQKNFSPIFSPPLNESKFYCHFNKQILPAGKPGISLQLLHWIDFNKVKGFWIWHFWQCKALTNKSHFPILKKPKFM